MQSTIGTCGIPQSKIHRATIIVSVHCYFLIYYTNSMIQTDNSFPGYSTTKINLCHNSNSL